MIRINFIVVIIGGIIALGAMPAQAQTSIMPEEIAAMLEMRERGGANATEDTKGQDPAPDSLPRSELDAMLEEMGHRPNVSSQAEPPEQASPRSDSFPSIAGRWRVHWTYEKRVPGARSSADETWEIRRDGDKLQMTRLGMMMLPEDMWRRDAVKLSDFKHQGKQLSFTGDGSRYTLTHDGDTMEGRFTAAPGSALGGGTVKFRRTVSFEKDVQAKDPDPKIVDLVKPVQGLWEVVLEITDADPLYRQEHFGADPNRARDYWEISLQGEELRIDRVNGTLLPPSMWKRESLSIKEVTAPEPPTLGFKTVEGEVRSVYVVTFHGDSKASGTFHWVDASFFPHAKAIEAKGRLKLTRIPDFATHISSEGVASLSDALRRQSALQERCARGDQQACEQYQREVTAFNSGIEFITGQISEEVKRLDASNVRRKEFLARLWKDSAAAAREAADQIDLQADKFQEGSQSRLDREGEAHRMREYAKEMDNGANELLGKK